MPSLFDERASNSCAQSWMAGVRRVVTSKELVTWCCRLGHRCDLELNSGSSRRFSIAFASTSSTCNWRSVTLTNWKLLWFGVFDRRPRLGVARTRILRSKKNYIGIGIYWSQERFQRFSFNLALGKCEIWFNDWVPMQEITSWRTQTPAFCVLISFWGALFVTWLLEEQLCANACHCEQHLACCKKMHGLQFAMCNSQLTHSYWAHSKCTEHTVNCVWFTVCFRKITIMPVIANELVEIVPSFLIINKWH